MPTVQDRGGSGSVTIPKRLLRKDGVLEDGEIPDDQEAVVERLDEGIYTVQIVEDGDVTQFHECEGIRRVAAGMILEDSDRQQLAD
jgi:hypothetical protein